MLLVCRKRGLFLVLWRFRVHECRAGRREGQRQGALSQCSGASSRAVVALRVRRLGVDKIKAHLGSFLRSAQEKVQACVTKEL